MSIQDEQQTAERRSTQQIYAGGVYYNAEWAKKHYEGGLNVQYRLVGNSRWKKIDVNFEWPDVVKGRDVRYLVGGRR